MKIAFIGQKGIPAQFGGVERHVEELTVRLAERGQEDFVYTRPWYTPSDLTHYRGVRLISVPSIKTKHFDAISHTFFSTIHAVLSGVDVIHYHGVGPSLLSFIPRLLSRRVKVVTTFHCIDRKHQKWNLLARLMLRLGEWTACQFAHQTITVSQALQHYCQEAYDADSQYIPNGVSLPQQMIGSQQIAEQFDLEPKEYILMVARLVRHKGAHYLIEAFKQLDTNKKLVIVGGSAFTDDYQQQLHDLAADDERIIFTGYQSGTVLAELFANASLFVLASESEGLPISVLEAMSHATPVLVSDIAESMEAVGSAGLTFKNKSVTDLVRALRQALAEPERLAQLGAAGQLRVRHEYDWHKITDSTIQLYRSLLPQPSGQPAAVRGTGK